MARRRKNKRGKRQRQQQQQRQLEDQLNGSFNDVRPLSKREKKRLQQQALGNQAAQAIKQHVKTRQKTIEQHIINEAEKRVAQLRDLRNRTKIKLDVEPTLLDVAAKSALPGTVEPL